MKFIGTYTTDLKNVLVASAVSGQNAITISAPGWGKTEMALATAWEMVGKDNTVFVELDPSTPPEAVRGVYDPAALLNGQLVRKFDGTPYDPNAKVVVLDEMYRSNDVVFDALIHATSMKLVEPWKRPVFWATSNFVGKSERTEALRDRFALWFWMEPQLDVRAMTMGHLFNGTGYDPDWGKDLPKWDDMVTIRQSHPSQRAADAVVSTIETLAGEAQANGFAVNPRRLAQWSSLLFGYSTLVTGTTDFATVPGEASKVLKYAYPTTDRATAAKWREVATAIVDQVGAMIEGFMGSALEKFRATANIKDVATRTQKITELGMVLANAQQELKRMGGEDPRVPQAIQTLTEWFGKAVKGETL